MLDAALIAELLAVAVVMVVAIHVILSVLGVQLLAAGDVLLNVKDALLHVLLIVATHAQMIVLVIVAQLAA